MKLKTLIAGMLVGTAAGTALLAAAPAMAQEKLTAVLVVCVFDRNEGLAKVRELRQKLVFDLLELA